MARQASNAIDNPAGINKAQTDSQDVAVTQTEERTMRSTGDASESLDMVGTLQRIDDRPVDGEKLAMLAFMDEPVTVRIATSTDKNAEQIFEICVNGRISLFRRGETKTVKRHIVDRLARMKQTIYEQKEVLNAEGVKDIVNVPHTALKYDFSVISDAHPRGAEWLRSVIAEPG